MTTRNWELFSRDPRDNRLPNNGVAQVERAQSPQQWEVVRWELANFVCEGQFAHGLERILGGFLANLARPQQQAVWVSGFYGSGKSHLVRVLDYLWRDVTLPGGDSARNLVNVTDEVADHLGELSGAGRRAGGLWSATGNLAAGRSQAPRLAFLSVLFASAGLPEAYSRARFVMWARRRGYYAKLEAAAEAAGLDLGKEIVDMYVSPVIAETLQESDSSLGSSVSDVRKLLEAQFPPTDADVTDAEMFAAVDEVLGLASSTAGRFPLTLVVLDEMQQYIGEDNAKALAVQNIVEGCSSRFNSQMLFVATGQSALIASPTLTKLTDRFAVQVALSDTDVESVVRQVVLRKRPERVAELSAALDAVSGEIDRQLGGTQLAPRAADHPDLVADYPLLPSRRRFWEVALRAIDKAGKSGVLRTQLRMAHDAALHVCEQSIGHVVGADFIYDEQSTQMQQSGAMHKTVDERIRSLRSEGADGLLQSRICALVYLLSQLPAQSFGGESGLRATAPYLADLLVEDLADEGAVLRRRVPELLEGLVSTSRLMRIGDEYRLQTEEGAVWEQEYRRALVVLLDDSSRLSQVRNERLHRAFEAMHGRIQLKHGVSKPRREVAWYWGDDLPAATEGKVPVWVRDEWSASEAAVKRSAAEAGDDSPVVFVFLPRRDPDQVKEASASYLAAEETLRAPTPQTEGGRDAQCSMKTRRDSESERLDRLLRQVVEHARVFQGGGAEATVSTLGSALETAAQRSLVRMFPKFSAGDNANWAKVADKVRDGAPDALVAVGYQGTATAHPVCKEVLATVNPAGIKGADLQRELTGPPYGWPRDAVSAAVLVLMAAGNIRATLDGRNLGSPRELHPSQVGKVTLIKEDEPPTASQRLAVRGLLSAAGIAHEAGKEDAQLPALLQCLKDLAVRAGGGPPLPEAPSVGPVDALLSLGGNQRFRAVADVSEALGHDLERWRAAGAKRDKREASWRDLQRLVRQADGLEIVASVAPSVEAIRDGRQLLHEPDPVGPLVAALCGVLRAELTGCAAEYEADRLAALAELESADVWTSLDPEARATILRQTNLVAVPQPDTSSVTRLLEALDATSLNGWRDRIGLVPGRRDQARQRAAKLAEPDSVPVAPPNATIRNRQNLDDYVEELRARVQPHLDAGRIVII